MANGDNMEQVPDGPEATTPPITNDVQGGPEGKSTDTLTKRSADAHESLVNYFLPNYPDLTRQELRNKIFNSARVFNNALRVYHGDKYPDRDFETFRTQYLKKFGSPMGERSLPREMRDYRKNDVPLAFSPHGSREYQNEQYEITQLLGETVKLGSPPGSSANREEIPMWDPDIHPKPTPEMGDPAFADRTVPAMMDTDALKVELDEMVRQGQDLALDRLRRDRMGSKDVPANEFYTTLNKDTPENLRQEITNRRRRMMRRTPVERAYGIEKGDMTISAFDEQIILLQDEILTINHAVKSVDRQLRDKYGENVFELLQDESEEYDELKRTVANDDLYYDRQNLVELWEKNMDVASNLAKQPEFEKVREVLELKQRAQVKRDQQYEAGYFRFSGPASLDPSSPDMVPPGVKGAIARAAGRLLQGIAEGADVLEELVTDDEVYNGWDLMEDYLRDLGNDLQTYYYPSPTATQGDLITKRSQFNIDGQDITVEYGDDGLPTKFMNQAGSQIPMKLDDLNPVDQVRVTNTNPDGSMNWAAAMYQTGDVMTDLAVQAMITRGVGTRLAVLGLPKSVAANTALTTALGAQMLPDIRKGMIETFGDNDRANYASILAVVGIGKLANVSGLEKSLAGMSSAGWSGKISQAALKKDFLAQIKNLSPEAAAARTAKQIGKTILGEEFEETIGEQLVIDASRVLFGGAPDEEIDWKQMMNTAILTFPAALLGGGSVELANQPDLEGNALYALSKDPELAEKAMLELHDVGALKIPKGRDPETYIAEQRDRFIDIAKQLEVVEPVASRNLDRGELAKFLDDRRNAKVNVERAKAFEWGPEKIAEEEANFEGYNAALSTALRTGKFPPVVPVAPKPSPEQLFVQAPKPEPPSEPVETIRDYEGKTVIFRGRRGIVTKDPDGNYRIRDKSGRSRGNLGASGDVPLNELNIKPSQIQFDDPRGKTPGSFTEVTEQPQEREERESSVTGQLRTDAGEQVPQSREESRRGTQVDERVARHSITKFAPTEAAKDLLAESGVHVDDELHEVDAETFTSLINEAKAENPFGAAVYVYPTEDYTNMRLFVSPDGAAGVAVKPDGDMVSVFSKPNGKKGQAGQLVALAIEQGAIKADAFSGYLPDYYSKFGFRAVAKQRWSDEYAPDDWDYDRFQAFNEGRPDVVYMVYDGGDRSTIKERYGTFPFYSEYEENVPYVEDYDEAIRLQEEAVSSVSQDLMPIGKPQVEPVGEPTGEPMPEPEPAQAEPSPVDVANLEGEGVDFKQSVAEELGFASLSDLVDYFTEKPILTWLDEMEENLQQGNIAEAQARLDGLWNDLQGEIEPGEIPLAPLPEDISEEEVDPEVEEQLDLGMDLIANDYRNLPYTALEARLEDSESPTVQAALEKFRGLPEHPGNRPAAMRGDAALDESFEKHKKRLIDQLEEWTTMDLGMAREFELGEAFDQDEHDTKVDQAFEEFMAKGMEEEAERVREMRDRPPEEDEDIDAMVEEAMNAPEPEDEFSNPTVLTDTEESLTEWEGMSTEELTAAEESLTQEISDAQRELIEAQNLAQEEAMDLQEVNVDARVNVSEIIKDLTQGQRQRVTRLRDKRKQVRKVIEERKSGVDNRAETQAGTGGTSPGFFNADLSILGVRLDSISRIGEFLAGLWVNAPHLSELINQFVPYRIGEVKAQNILRSALTKTGKLGDLRIWELDKRRENAINRFESEGRLIDREFRKALKQMGDLTPEIAKELDTILKDPNLNHNNDWQLADGTDIPVDVIVVMRKMRSLIDRLSTELISSGAVDGDLIGVITDNMGIYVTRHYRVHFDPSWKRMVTRFKGQGSVYNRARNYLGGELIKEKAEGITKRNFIQTRLDRAQDDLADHQSRPGQDRYQEKEDRIIKRIDFWENQLSNQDDYIAQIDHNYDNLDAYVESIIDKHVFSAHPTTGSTLGSKPMGILNERAKSIRNPERRRIRKRIKSAQAQARKAVAKRKILERELRRERGRTRATPLGLRDKKMAIKRLNQRNERRIQKYERDMGPVLEEIQEREDARAGLENALQEAEARLEERVAAREAAEPGSKREAISAAAEARQEVKDAQQAVKTNQRRIDNLKRKERRIEEKVDEVAQKIRDNEAQIARIDNDIDLIKNVPYKSVQKLQDAITALRNRETNLLTQINQELIALEEVRRMDIPKPLRDLLGEVEDPAMNFAATIHKQALLLENHKFLNRILEVGLDNFIFTGPNTAAGATIQIAAEGSDALAPLNGMYVNEQIYDAFHHYAKMGRDTSMMSQAMMVSGAIKSNLTVLYHMVCLRNMMSASLYGLLQGEVGPTIYGMANWLFMEGNLIGVGIQGIKTALNLPDFRMSDRFKERGSIKQTLAERLRNPNDTDAVVALKSIAQTVVDMLLVDAKDIENINKVRNVTFGLDVWERTRPELEEMYLWAKEEGLFDEDFTVASYYQALERFKGKALPEEIAGPPDLGNRPPQKGSLMWVVDGAKKGIKYVRDKSADRYRSSDNMGRLFRAMQEMETYARALHGTSFENLTPEQQTAVRTRASQVAKLTYPTMSEVPPLVKELSRFPFLADFVTFTVANTRTVMNTPRVAITDLQNPRTVGVGLKRLSGLAISASLPNIIQAGIAAVTGIGYDDEENEKLDLFDLDFNQGAPSVRFKVTDDDGLFDLSQFYTINIGSIAPVSSVTDPIANTMGWAVGRTSQENMLQGWSNYTRPFVSTGILYESVLEAMYNTKEIGKEIPITKISQTRLGKARARLGHVTGFRNPVVIRENQVMLRDPEIRTGGIVPGTIGMVYRMGKALTGSPTSYGTLYNPGHEALRWMVGTNVMKIDIESSASRKHYTVNANIDLLGKEWKKVWKDGRLKDLSDDQFWAHPEVKYQMRRLQSTFDTFIAKGHEYYQGAQELGLDPDKNEETLNYRRNDVKYAVRTGQRIPFDFKTDRGYPPEKLEEDILNE